MNSTTTDRVLNYWQAIEYLQRGHPYFSRFAAEFDVVSSQQFFHDVLVKSFRTGG